MPFSARVAPALGAALALSLPAAAAHAEEAPAAEQQDTGADLARDQQTPSPGGPGKPRAVVVDRPDFQLAVRGFGQFTAIPFIGKDALVAEGDAADYAGMRVRRAELGLEGKAGKHLSFGVWLDLANTPLLTQARLAYSFIPEASIETGVVKIPFSKSAIQSSAELTFAERPLSVANIVPERQPGIAVYGSLLGGRASYRAGVFNGAATGRAASGNDHPGVLWAARVAASPLGALRAGQSDVERGPLRFELAANAFHNDAAGFTQTALGVDATLQAYGFSLLAEYLQDTRTPLSQVVLPSTLVDTIKRTGYVGQLSYMLWKDGLELAVRAESVDDNVAIQDAGDVNAQVFGLHWYPMGLDLRVNLDYYHRTERSPAPVLDNDALVLGTQGRF